MDEFGWFSLQGVSHGVESRLVGFLRLISVFYHSPLSAIRMSGDLLVTGWGRQVRMWVGIDVGGGIWENGRSSVTERFFSGVPHAHLLGVCHRAPFFVPSTDPLGMEGGEHSGWVGAKKVKG